MCVCVFFFFGGGGGGTTWEGKFYPYNTGGGDEIFLAMRAWGTTFTLGSFNTGHLSF